MLEVLDLETKHYIHFYSITQEVHGIYKYILEDMDVGLAMKLENNTI